MSKPLKKPSAPKSIRGLEPIIRSKRVPHGFILDAIAEVCPTTRAMFGALAVYVGEKIVFLLRDRPADPQANGVWLAIPTEFQESLHTDFPNAGPVRIMGKEISGWRLLAVAADDLRRVLSMPVNWSSGTIPGSAKFRIRSELRPEFMH